MRNKIHDPQAYLVVLAENIIEDHLHGDEFVGTGNLYLSVGGSLSIQESILREVEHRVGN
jgi:hypothetical protein